VPRDRRTILLIGLYALAGLLLAGLIAEQLSHDRFSDCMGLDAFSRKECEDYARE
jgi:hypothetical protein